jgi:hydrogenase maturation protease
MRAETVIIGLGNDYLRDEGVGVRVVAELERRGQVPAGVEALDLGTGGLAVLHALRGRRKAVLVDCAYMDEPPGAWRRFTPAEVESRRVGMRFSLHEGDVLQTLALSRQLGEGPAEVWLIGVQPACVTFGKGLSPALRDRFEEYVAAALAAAGGGPEACHVAH